MVTASVTQYVVNHAISLIPLPNGSVLLTNSVRPRANDETMHSSCHSGGPLHLAYRPRPLPAGFRGPARPIQQPDCLKNPVHHAKSLALTSLYFVTKGWFMTSTSGRRSSGLSFSNCLLRH